MKFKTDIKCQNLYTNVLLEELKQDFSYDQLSVIAQVLDNAYEAGYDNCCRDGDYYQ